MEAKTISRTGDTSEEAEFGSRYVAQEVTVVRRTHTHEAVGPKAT